MSSSAKADRKCLRERSISDADPPDTDTTTVSSSALVPPSTRSEEEPVTKTEEDEDGEPVSKRAKVVKGWIPSVALWTPVSTKKRIESRLRKARLLPRSHLLGAHVTGQRLSMPGVAKEQVKAALELEGEDWLAMKKCVSPPQVTVPPLAEHMSCSNNCTRRRRVPTSWDSHSHSTEEWQARRDFEIDAFGASNIAPQAGPSLGAASNVHSLLPSSAGVPFAAAAAPPATRRPRGRPSRTASAIPTRVPSAPAVPSQLLRDHIFHFQDDGEITTHSIPPLKCLRLELDDDQPQLERPDNYHDNRGDNEEMNDQVEGGPSKRKWYQSSDDPMKEWMPWRDTMILEMLRHHHGLGNDFFNPCCISCGVQLSDTVPLYRCTVEFQSIRRHGHEGPKIDEMSHVSLVVPKSDESGNQI
ncbi:hypothetical protein BDZ89DRAFT_1052692 [Hymenopellis radicata]|nr:hypothetical protein BDZ89DRAFT_1052692 [Hymenopellis radicata]